MLNTKFCLIQEFDNLEWFRAKAIHYNYARHSHPGYSIGVIESGVGGNYYQGSTYLAPPKSIFCLHTVKEAIAKLFKKAKLFRKTIFYRQKRKQTS